MPKTTFEYFKEFCREKRNYIYIVLVPSVVHFVKQLKHVIFFYIFIFFFKTINFVRNMLSLIEKAKKMMVDF